MSLQSLSEWLRCPNCFLPLTSSGRLVLACDSGHAFDANKRGYVSLLSGAHKFIGDSAVMLDARDRFQSGGWYEPLRDAISHVIGAESPRRILDIGCGSGYYLRGVLPPEPSSIRALGMDLSPAAVVRTVQHPASIDGLVADVWSPLPIRNGAADVILNVFAPRNAAEFHRVLRPGGLLLVVVPQPTHLQELRAAGLAVDMQQDKAVHLTAGLAEWFVPESRTALSRLMYLDAVDVAALIGMGPSAHHTDPASLGSAEDVQRDVTAAFDLFSFRRRDLA